MEYLFVAGLAFIIGYISGYDKAVWKARDFMKKVFELMDECGGLSPDFDNNKFQTTIESEMED